MKLLIMQKNIFLMKVNKLELQKILDDKSSDEELKKWQKQN
jgi:hypothetical protein